MICTTLRFKARLHASAAIAAFLLVAVWPTVAAVSLGPRTTNAAEEKMKQELKFYDAKMSLQQQIKAGKVRYELREANRAEAIQAMAAQLKKRRQAVAISSLATSLIHNKSETGMPLWALLIIAALGVAFFGGRYYRNHRLKQHHTS